jgi:hypothetical protein
MACRVGEGPPAPADISLAVSAVSSFVPVIEGVGKGDIRRQVRFVTNLFLIAA